MDNGSVEQFTVKGSSMEPTLRDGDVVTLALDRDIHIGDIVVARHPYMKRLIIKRISAIMGNTYHVRGDSSNASTDSSAFGDLKRSHILGKISINEKPA